MPTKAGPRKSAAKTKTKSKTKTAAKGAAKKTTAKRAPAKKAAPVLATSCRLEPVGGNQVPPVWMACSTDVSRPALVHPWLIRTGPPSRRRFFLCATDSYQAVRVPVRPVNDSGDVVDVDEALLGSIDVKAVKAWTKPAKQSHMRAELVLTATDSTVIVHGEGKQVWDRPQVGKPLDLNKLIRGYLETDRVEEYTIGFNPEIFAKVAGAIGRGKGTSPVVLRFAARDGLPGPNGLRPFVVTGTREKQGAGKFSDLETVAILMPVRV